MSEIEAVKERSWLAKEADHFLQVAKHEATQGRRLVFEALKSGAYTYPIQGLIYFAAHSTLWKPLTSRLLPLATLSAGVVASMFFFTYVPQATLLFFVNGPLAVVSTVFLVLTESSWLIDTIATKWILKHSLANVYDATLISRGQADLVRKLRPVTAGHLGTVEEVDRLGDDPSSSDEPIAPSPFARRVLYFGLNFVPVVGIVLSMLGMSRSRGEGVHSRYFKLKRMNSKQQDQWHRKNEGATLGFGFAATVLELIPFVNIFFKYTNTVGGALWAADLETLNKVD